MVRNTTKIIKLFFFGASGVTLRGRERSWEGNHSSVTLEGVQIFKVTEQERLVEVFWHVLLGKRTWAYPIRLGNTSGYSTEGGCDWEGHPRQRLKT